MLLFPLLFAVPASGVLHTLLAPAIGGLEMEALALMDALHDPNDPADVLAIHFVGDGLTPTAIFPLSPQTSPRFRYLSVRRRRAAPPSPSSSSSSSSKASENNVQDEVPWGIPRHLHDSRPRLVAPSVPCTATQKHAVHILNRTVSTCFVCDALHGARLCFDPRLEEATTATAAPRTTTADRDCKHLR